MKVIRWISLVATPLAVLLASCESKDPGLEEEVSRLRQENGELRGRLDAAERSGHEASTQVDEQTAALKQQLETAQAALTEMESRFDRKRLEASFASAVSDFKQETLKKFPGSTISQVTLHQMVMPSDHPFSSGVTLMLNDESAGTSRTIHVKALGNIEGNWTFKKVDADSIATSQPEVGAPPVETPVDSSTASTSGSGETGQTDVPPQPPVIRRTGGQAEQSSGGRVYRIDWGD